MSSHWSYLWAISPILGTIAKHSCVIRVRVGDPCCPFHQNFQINLNHILVDSFCAERSQILVQCPQMMLPQKYWKWSAQNLLCFGAKYVFGEIGHNSETDELMNRECCAISFGSFCTLWWWFGFKREPTLPRMDQP